MTTAVTGAAGYLGTQMLLSLRDRGQPALALNAGAASLPALDDMPVHDLAALDTDGLTALLRAREVREIVHFAGSGQVNGSLDDPLHEYEDTLQEVLLLARAATQAGVARFVLSSTASVYGVPDRMPIKEETPLRPISPYGAAMGMAERIVSDTAAAAGFTTATLRYFNVAGADPLGRAGETGKPRHLIKAAAQIAVGTRAEPLRIYGDDYETPDGTPIRDYLHVSDMADAHMAALDYLRRGGPSAVLNCGYGEGVSVREVVSAVERVTGRPLPTVIAPRRPGDPPQLIADDAKIRTLLGWAPRFDDIDLIVRSAIEWEDTQKSVPAEGETAA
ncbi:UDP-glucose 4-epimerase GalE [Parvularcula oceani]|uniref:UDP-glucose 4-epimerase GalE n=1 Tax=Parvularcula oceani TaxID=1247963 RepID=UPI0004E19925|nr:UDP-glucose 4-epimerase GalE [Parvularcula oceani]